MQVDTEDPALYSYAITPTCLVQQNTSINAIAATSCMRWVLSAGSDGVVRKYDFFQSLNGKSKLPPTQMLGLPESLCKGGVCVGQFSNQSSTPQDYDDFTSIEARSVGDTNRPIFSIELESQAIWALLGQIDGTISLCTTRHESGTILHTFNAHKAQVNQLKLLQCQTKFLSGSWDGQIHLWDLNDGSKAQTWSNHQSQIVSIDLHPTQQSQLFMSCSFDGQCSINDLRTGISEKSFVPNQNLSNKWCHSAVYSKDGNYIYLGNKDSSIQIYDIRSNCIIKEIQFPIKSGPVTSILSLSNNQSLLAGSTDCIRMINVQEALNQSNEVSYQVISGHYGGSVSQMLVDQDEKFLVSSSGTKGWQSLIDNHQMVFYEIEQCYKYQEDNSLNDIDVSNELY